jgi:hypothetical protein
MAIELSELLSDILRLGLRWQAGETDHTGQSLLQAKSRCGAVPPEGTTLADREERARAALHYGGPRPSGVPAAWDWRDVGGLNYVTPIEDQLSCGSCVAFGTIATFEAQVQIAFHGPNLGVDLSEAQLWFCYGPSHGAGACPTGGWWPTTSFPGLIPGIAPSACFPYTPTNQPCNLCPTWNTQLTKISSWTTLTNAAAMKAFIAQTGTLTACFTVYADFYYHYTGGVYEHDPKTDTVVGGHCISVVGYTDAGQYWICKNSWGSTWGESGFFCIGYGQCGITSEMWGINGTITSEVWHPPLPILPIFPRPIFPRPINPGPINPGPIRPGPISIDPGPLQGAATQSVYDPDVPQVEGGSPNVEV